MSSPNSSSGVVPNLDEVFHLAPLLPSDMQGDFSIVTAGQVGQQFHALNPNAQFMVNHCNNSRKKRWGSARLNRLVYLKRPTGANWFVRSGVQSARGVATFVEVNRTTVLPGTPPMPSTTRFPPGISGMHNLRP